MTLICRVPLDFDWPLHRVWGGFLMDPDLALPDCPDCSHDRTSRQPTGLTAAAWGIHATFYATSAPEPFRSQICWHDKITQAEVDHLLSRGRLRSLVRNNDGTSTWESLPLSAADVNAAQDGGHGHDSVNQSILFQYRCERLGIDVNCSTCGGKASVGTPEQFAAIEEWEPTDPPTGDGWQVWEDVSAGSPISPVFRSRDGVVTWLTSPDGFGTAWGLTLPYAEAEALVDAGGSCGSTAIVDGVVLDGNRAVAAARSNG